MSSYSTISDLAREFAITTRAIRFYEDEGLIAPKRDGQKRLYAQRDRVRLMLILRGRRLGFSLKEIAEIIDLYDREPGEQGQLKLFLAKIAERRLLLKQQQEDIKQTLGELDQVEANCQRRLGELQKR
ncbi:MAG: MerR family DNA-binding transcriptional regulator [Rhodospirillales bacterium]|jgi:DNA-binding transcriptional MerR regulator|nr:MerR family DNA-binding transcriptional regulator [Rhodospirillales bacterium]